jgi:hypothetical protein
VIGHEKSDYVLSWFLAAFLAAVPRFMLAAGRKNVRRAKAASSAGGIAAARRPASRLIREPHGDAYRTPGRGRVAIRSVLTA